MSKKEKSFRLHVRFSTVEYSDLDEDLANFSGSDKAARVRMLMRIGLQTLKGQAHGITGAGAHPHLAPVVDMQRSLRQDAPKTDQADNAPPRLDDQLPNLGWDFGNFKYGGKQ